jgi:hypothetical protein
MLVSSQTAACLINCAQVTSTGILLLRIKAGVAGKLNAARSLAADTKAMRESAPMIPVWDDHEYTK